MSPIVISLANLLLAGNVEFQWTDGIIGMSLSQPQHDGYRTLYFCPMSSSKLFAVSTQVIQNRTTDWSGWNNTEIFHRFRVVGDRGAFMQSTTSTIDENTGVMFFTLLCQDSIACWNTNEEYTSETRWYIARDREKLSYPNDMKVDKNGILWLTSNRLHEFIFTGQNFSDVNFRIFSVSVGDAIAGTSCGKQFEMENNYVKQEDSSESVSSK